MQEHECTVKIKLLANMTHMLELSACQRTAEMINNAVVSDKIIQGSSAGRVLVC